MSDNNYGKDPINDVLLIIYACILAIVMLVTCVGCGSTIEYDNKRSAPENSEFEKLKETVLQLQGTLAQITSFVASDFSSCSISLPPFQTMMCQIAQTANAEQQVLFIGQMQEIAKIFQNELYGTDCLNTTDPGCPVVGSITARVIAAEANITTAQSNITSLLASVASLNASMATLTARLNNFNGSGSSVETIITGIQSDIATLDSRLDSLEQTVNNGDIYKTYLICGNIPSSGPAYEPILITGDNTIAVAYVVSGTSNGMGEVAKAGVTGSQYLTTRANSANCKFKIYDRTTSIKLCWKNTDRNATAGAIDTACNAPTFANPLATCTCVN